jgi:hypothetical protein
LKLNEWLEYILAIQIREVDDERVTTDNKFKHILKEGTARRRLQKKQEH